MSGWMTMPRPGTYLCGLAVDAVQDGLEGRGGEPGFLTGLLVLLESRSHALRAIVIGIAEWLVDGLQVPAGHEDLQSSHTALAKRGLTPGNYFEAKRGLRGHAAAVSEPAGLDLHARRRSSTPSGEWP